MLACFIDVKQLCARKTPHSHVSELGFLLLIFVSLFFNFCFKFSHYLQTRSTEINEMLTNVIILT